MKRISIRCDVPNVTENRQLNRGKMFYSVNYVRTVMRKLTTRFFLKVWAGADSVTETADRPSSYDKQQWMIRYRMQINNSGWMNRSIWTAQKPGQTVVNVWCKPKSVLNNAMMTALADCFAQNPSFHILRKKLGPCQCPLHTKTKLEI